MISFQLPFTLVSLDNVHKGWRDKYKEIVKPQREGARLALTGLLSKHEPAFIKRHKIPVQIHGGKKRASIFAVHQLVSPILVRISRVYGPGKRALDPHDGLPSSCKPTVDGLADALGLRDDHDPLVKFEYYQRKGDGDACEVQIWERSERQIHVADVPAYVLGAESHGAKLVGGRLRLLQEGRVIDVSLKVG